MKAYIFTEQSISIVFNQLNDLQIKNRDFNNENLICIKEKDIKYIISTWKKDSDFLNNSIIIIYEEDVGLFDMNFDAVNDILQKLHRVSIHTQKHKTNSLPPWTIYHEKNKVVIASSTISGDRRIFVEHTINQTGNIALFKIIDGKKNISLSDYNINEKVYDTIINDKKLINDLYHEALQERKISEIETDFNFDLIYEDKEQFTFTYDQWIEKLSKLQLHFVNKDIHQAIKLKGPAGTGKTLAMEIKAAKILRENCNAKILFLTHSWTVACQVQDFLDNILENEQKSRIDVYPLLTIAEGKTRRSHEMVTLGEDSLSGKIEQLTLMKNIINEFLATDWIAYSNKCSQKFSENIENTKIGDAQFAWDIIIEIACVIGANGIMPIVNANQKYKKIDRRPWMMNLENEVEKDVVFELYRRLMEYLKKERKVTSDQVMNDYLNYLATYDWFYLRSKIGYDYIFIDEMQLFNEQERMSFHYLTRDPNEYPVLYMALDPRQSIIETYFDYGLSSVANQANGNSEISFGKIEDILLDEAYRYTPQILAFLKHIDSSFPAMGLSTEWENKIDKITTKKDVGNIVTVQINKSFEEEMESAIKIATEFVSQGKRTAILVLNFDDYKQYKESSLKNQAYFIESKNDTLKLMYAKRRIIVSQPYYVIGLQFDVVILTSCYQTYNPYDANQSYNNRRFISDAYLGASRAKSNLFVSANSSKNYIPDFLKSAIEKGIVNEIKILK